MKSIMSYSNNNKLNLADISDVNPLSRLFSPWVVESETDYKFTGNMTLTNSKIFSNLQNVSLDFGKSKIQWETTTGITPTYNGSKWVYSVQNAITFDGLVDCKITNLEFIQDKTNSNIKTWAGVVLRNCTNVEISNSLIDGFNWVGIVVESSCKDCKVVKNKVYRCRFGLFDQGTNTLVENNDVSNKYAESQECSANGGVWLPATSTYDSAYYDGIMAFGTNSEYKYNRVYDNGQSGIYSSQSNHCKIIDNTVENNFNAGIDMGVTDGTSKIFDALVSLNTVRNNKNNDINITGVNDSIFSNNKVESSIENRFGIIMTGSSSNNTVTGNKVRHSGIEQGSRGISVASSCKNNKVLINDVKAPTPYSVGGSTNVLFVDDNASFKKRLDVDLTANTGYAGRAILNLMGSLDNTYIQLISNMEVRFTDSAGVPRSVKLGDLVSGSLTVTGEVLSINAGTKFKLGQTASSAEGYFWYNSAAKALQYSDGSGTSQTLATV